MLFLGSDQYARSPTSDNKSSSELPEMRGSARDRVLVSKLNERAGD